jgi:hypothetical protein
MEKMMVVAKVMRVGATILIERNPSLQDDPCLKLEFPLLRADDIGIISSDSRIIWELLGWFKPFTYLWACSISMRQSIVGAKFDEYGPFRRRITAIGASVM